MRCHITVFVLCAIFESYELNKCVKRVKIALAIDVVIVSTSKFGMRCNTDGELMTNVEVLILSLDVTVIGDRV